MRHYELVVVLSPMLNQDQATETWERIKGFISTREAEITHEEKWGTRRLAYSIRKGPYHFQEGNYNLTRFRTETPFNQDLETFLKFDDQVLRSMVIATDTPVPATQPMMRPPAPPPAPVVAPAAETSAETVPAAEAVTPTEADTPTETGAEATVAAGGEPVAAAEEETSAAAAEEKPPVAEAEAEEPAAAAEEETPAAEAEAEETVAQVEEPATAEEPVKAEADDAGDDKQTGTPEAT